MSNSQFCDNCGNELESGSKFCTKCGHRAAVNTVHNKPRAEDKWWERLFKVVYIVAYLPLILILILVWSESSSDYSYYTRTYTDTTGAAIWYCFLTILIYFAIMRLLKVAFLYITNGQKPNWKAEFKKLF